jgi:DNA topoisomerase-1
MLKDIRDVASILDGAIEKSIEIEMQEEIKAKSKRLEIRKALSFDPMRPLELGEDTTVYNPYRMMPDGTYAPHSAQYWADQAKYDLSSAGVQYHRMARNPDGYRESEAMLSVMKAVIDDTISKAIKQPKQPGAGKVPIGTVHEYSDGQSYKKVGPGDWQPVQSGSGQHPVEQDFSNKRTKIEKELAARKNGKQVSPVAERTKQANKKLSAVTQREQDLSTKEAEVSQREVEHRSRELDLKESQLKSKEAESKQKEAESKQKAKDAKKAEAQKADDLKKRMQGLQTKLARGKPGEGREVKLSKDELGEVLKKGKYALLSAGRNPAIDEELNLPDDEIKKRYDELEKKLIEAGYAYNKVKGKYGEEEDSFMIMAHDADREHVVELGKLFNQDSVIYSEGGKHEMIYTTGDKVGKKVEGKGHKLLPESEGDYYTQMDTEDGGVKFSLNFNFDDVKEIKSKSPEQVKAFETAKSRGYKVPPAWENVWVNPDPEAALQVKGTDSKGRSQSIYSSKHHNLASMKKFNRLKQFGAAHKQFMPKIEAALETSDEAKVLYLIDKTGFRIGSDNETGAKVKAYGASTLTSDHVRVNGNKVTFEFVGKKGVKQSQTIDDPKIAAMVKGKQGRLFNTNDSKVRDYLKNISGKKDFKVKDFRTYVATTTALEASDRLPPPSDKPMTAKEKATKIMDVAKEVSRKLGNTPVMARDSYIDPMVFDRYEVVG